MAKDIFRRVLWASLTTAVACGNNRFPVSDSKDIRIAGRTMQIIPYTESGLFGSSQAYILCENNKKDCYSASAYKKKLTEEVDRALGK